MAKKDNEFREFTQEEKKEYAKKKQAEREKERAEAKKQKSEFSASISKRVLEALKKGKDETWTKPWKNMSFGGPLPFNAQTGRPYARGNIMSLFIDMMSRGFEDTRFCSEAQAKKYAQAKWAEAPAYKDVEWEKVKSGQKTEDLAKSKDWRIREFLAWDKDTDTGTLEILGRDENVNVRRRVANNKNASDEIRKTIQESGDLDVEVKEDQQGKGSPILIPVFVRKRKTEEEILNLLQENGRDAFVSGRDEKVKFIPNPNYPKVTSFYVLKEGEEKPKIISRELFEENFVGITGEEIDLEQIDRDHKTQWAENPAPLSPPGLQSRIGIQRLTI